MMSEEQRKEWKAQAKNHNYSTFNAFLSAYMRS
jgi:hypothetical protein